MAQSFNHWGKLADSLTPVLGQVVRKTAFDLDAAHKAFMRANGQIDTGHMINSGYVVTHNESTYSGSDKDLPAVETPPDELTAYAAIAASYGFWQNYGTTRIPARPFHEPAIAQVQPEFEDACSKIEPALKAKIGT